MKKIVSQPSTLVLGEDSIIQPTPTPVSSPVAAPRAIPPKNVLGQSLSSLKGFDQLRRDIKMQHKIAEFVSETTKVLSLFDLADRKYDHQVLLYVMQLAEHTFISERKLGAVKEVAVVDSVKQFYNNDEELVKSIIQIVLPQIEKTNALRRAKSKLKSFFLIGVKVLLGISLM